MAVPTAHRYLPIIPMVLVNGADGIGTGWSSRVPNFDPIAICNYLRAKIRSEETEQLVPFFRGFTGRIEADAKKPGRCVFTHTLNRSDRLLCEFIVTNMLLPTRRG